MTQVRTLWSAPPPMDPQEAEQALRQLRADYAGRWHIFRSQVAGQSWWWYASIRHPAAGVDQTVSAPGPGALRAELERQRQLWCDDRLSRGLPVTPP